jgi:LysR family transcriptional regulator, hydrogen peroxide-inducible genes activator
VELHQLRYVIAVAEQGSFTKAAERLYLAQPSLSVQIRKLEQELGAPLFERLGRRVRMTAAGEAFLPHARRAVFESEQARERVAEVAGLAHGRVALGVLPSVGARLLPTVLAQFTTEHPGVEVRLLEQNVSGEFERLVHDGQLDLAVIRMPKQRADLRVERLVREPLLALVPPGHRLFGGHDVALSELAGEPFVGMQPGYGLRELMDETCRAAGFLPRVVVETTQLSIVHGMVQAGIGVSLLPRLAVGNEVAALSLRDRAACRELGVVWRYGPPLEPAVRAFLDLMLQRASAHSAPGG